MSELKEYCRKLHVVMGFKNLDLIYNLKEVGESNMFGIKYDLIRSFHLELLESKNTSAVVQRINKLSQKNNLNHYINEFGFNLLFFVRSDKIVNTLLKNGVDANHLSNDYKDLCYDRSTQKTSAIHYASWYGLKPVVMVLIDALADINLLDGDGCTPMGYAQEKYEQIRRNGFSHSIDEINIFHLMKIMDLFRKHSGKPIY